MFNKVKIETGLYGIVGLRQPFNPTYQILDADNQVSRSGYFVTDNPFVKVEYVKDSQDFDNITDLQFNAQLKQIQQSAIASVCNAIFNESSYLDRQVLYPFAQNKVNVDTIPDGMICHEIEVAIEKNIAFEISRVMLNFQGAGTLKLMLFNTSESAPIHEKDVVISSSHQSEPLNWVVDNSGDTYKGKYYFGYIVTSGLKPYKRDYENSDVTSQITGLNITKVFFNGHTTETLPDLNTEQSTDFTTGLNPDITVYEDYTDMILNNAQLFGYAVYLDFCIKLISMYISSLRSNRNQRLSEGQIVRMMQEIEGQSGLNVVKITGLRSLLNGELSRLTKEIQSIKEGYFGGIINVQTLM